ncbi:MAG TPA: HD domain-containing protein, partial [Pseudonocardiaceae bacterium]|nr:HD domain-containing protein [Pseudonocardiaceae bacterium]
MDFTTWAAEVARRYLAEQAPRRWAHVRGAGRQAEHIGRDLLPGDERELLVAAALLHDVGYAKPLARSGFHPLDGAWFLTDAGVPPRVCALV